MASELIHYHEKTNESEDVGVECGSTNAMPQKE
jgi:hypothetical protein